MKSLYSSAVFASPAAIIFTAKQCLGRRVMVGTKGTFPYALYEAQATGWVFVGMTPNDIQGPHTDREGRVFYAAAPAVDSSDLIFGDGVDGSVTLDGTVAAPAFMTKVGSVYYPTRDLYLQNLTLTGTAQVVPATSATGQMCGIFINGILDLSTCAVGAINCNGANGGGVTVGGTGGTIGSIGRTSGFTSIGSIGSAGTNGSSTSSVAASGPIAVALSGGGASGTGGQGGNGTSGNNGASAHAATAPTATAFIHVPLTTIARALSLIGGGSGGPGGTGGGGDGTNTGGGAGAGGNGADTMGLWARTIITSASTPAGAIQANGGNAGTGAAPAVTSSNAAGGGAGAPGGGGYASITYKYRLGPVVTNLIQANSGAPANGGNSYGTGLGGTSSQPAYGGRITLFNLQAGVCTQVAGTIGTTPTAPSGNTGGIAGTAGLCQASL